MSAFQWLFRSSWLLCAVGLLAGCSSKLSRFDVIQMQGSNLTTAAGYQIPRGETAAQGSGTAQSANHVLERVTIGGNYLRRPVAAVNGSTLEPGLHAGSR